MAVDSTTKCERLEGPRSTLKERLGLAITT
jgi:hypothetical protein